MRLVIDRNVLQSGLFWHGKPHQLLKSVRSAEVTMVTSPAVLAELADVIGRAKFAAILAHTKRTPQNVIDDV